MSKKHAYMTKGRASAALAWIIGVAIFFSAAVSAGAASKLTAADIDMLLSLGLISQEKANVAKANLKSQPIPVRPASASPTVTSRSSDPTNPPAPASSADPSKSAKRYVFTKDLQMGSNGADVIALQNLLGIYPATGNFGSLTKAAVIKYQTQRGISPVNGHVGPKTRAALNADAATKP
jgi:peptidoglycan hydrolase-like protein with peptidoglycan-binding domain